MFQPSPTNSGNLPSQDLVSEFSSLRQHFGPSMADSLVDRRSPLPLDNAFVQQTKDQIRSIVESIAILAHSPIEPSVFLANALPKIVNAMGAQGAALWHQVSENQWRLLGSNNLNVALLAIEETSGSIENRGASEPSASSFEQLDFLESQLDAVSQALGELPEPFIPSPASTVDSLAPASNPNESRPSDAHLAILNAVSREKQPILIPPGEVVLDRQRPVNPISDLLIFAPLTVPKEIGSFWLQVVQTPSGGPSSQRGYLRFVSQMADLLSDYYRSHRLRAFERDKACLSLAEKTMTELARCSNHKKGISRLLNIVREHARSEHAFLVRKPSRFGNYRVEGAAGLAEIDRRAEGINLIERSMRGMHELLPMGGGLRSEQLDGSVEDRDPDLTRVLNTLAVTEFHWIPLLEVFDGRKVGILITWSGLDRPPMRCKEQCGLIVRLGLSALQIPWWRDAIQSSEETTTTLRKIAKPWTWPRSVQAVMVLALVAIVLWIPVPIGLHATAIVVPLVQQHVYAPMDATVESISVEHGQRVHAGELLMQLRSDSLETEHDQLLAQQLRSFHRLADIEARLLRETALSTSQRYELEGERESLLSVRPFEKAQLEQLDRQISSLRVVAKVDGVIATWNAKENLSNRPLRTGQWLLSLHETGTRWVLETALPEHDAREFQHAIEQDSCKPFATLTSMPQSPLPVRYCPDSIPRFETFQQNGSAVEPRDGVLRLRFELATENISDPENLAGATARISIPAGRGPLAWALGKDFLKKVWSRVQMWI